MLAGVTIVDPASTWIEAGVEIEPDVVVHPYTVIRGGVRIEGGAEIGPFAYVRPVSVVGEGAKIGTFVEVKNAAVGAGAKIPHLSYVGDAEIGDGYEHRGRQHHRQLPARAGRAEGQDEDRPQRQDRRGHCLRCSCRDWRRRLDCSGDRHHG